MEHSNTTINDINMLDEKRQKYTAGPLNLNRRTKQATTVMGTDLQLGDYDFEALDLMVSNEGEYLTLQQLSEVSWSKSPTPENTEESQTSLNNLIQQINNAGGEFMWVENKPGKGFTFKTRWGQTWNEPIEVDPFTLQSTRARTTLPNTTVNIEKSKKQRPSRTALLTGAGALVATFLLVLLLLYSTGIIAPTSAEPLYIDVQDTNIPLASPEFEDPE